VSISLRLGPPGLQLLVRIKSVPQLAGLVTTDTSGEADQAIQLPGSLPPGQHTMELIDVASNTVVASTMFDVVAPSSCASSGNMPDKDLDTLPDSCDPNSADGPTGDADGDSVLNQADNCPAIANQGQADGNANDLGDVCDPATGALLVNDAITYPPTPLGSSFVPVVPGRLLETRGAGTVDGRFEGGGARAAGSVTELQVTGRYGIPSDAAAVVLNVTVTGPKSGGYVTVWPCGSPPPNASSLNFDADVSIPNAVIVKVGTDGKVCLFTTAATHLLTDINGYFGST
jgi:hypothetical protein